MFKAITPEEAVETETRNKAEYQRKELEGIIKLIPSVIETFNRILSNGEREIYVPRFKNLFLLCHRDGNTNDVHLFANYVSGHNNPVGIKHAINTVANIFRASGWVVVVNTEEINDLTETDGFVNTSYTFTFSTP